MPIKRLRARVNYDGAQFEIGDCIDIRAADLPQLESVGAVEDPPAPVGPAVSPVALGGEQSRSAGRRRAK